MIIPVLLAIKALTACEAVTAADLQTALGVAFGRGVEAAGVCDYSARNAAVSIAVRKLAVKPDLALEMDAMRRELPGAIARRVEGIAEAAFVLEIPGAGAQVHAIRADGEYVMVSILGLGEAANVERAAARLARLALSRL